MTLKQKRLIEALPTAKNFTEAGIIAGYAPNYAGSSLKTDLRRSKVMKDYFDEATIKRDIHKMYRKCLKSEDNTNCVRLLEVKSKIAGLQRDVSTNVNINIDMAVEAKALRSKYNIDT